MLPLAGDDAAAGIPEDVVLLVAADPVRDLGEALRAAVEAHLGRGGRLLWLLDPQAGGEGPRPPPPAILGVRSRPGVLTDAAAGELLALEDPAMLLLENLPPHPVNATVPGPLLLHRAAALVLDDAPWQRRPLLQAGPGSRGASSGGGPALIGVALSRPAPGTEQRAAVLADSDLFAGAFIGSGGNLAFGLALVDWLTGAEGFGGEYVRTAPDQRLELPRHGGALLGAVFLLVIPGLLGAGALRAWWRQHRG